MGVSMGKNWWACLTGCGTSSDCRFHDFYHYFKVLAHSIQNLSILSFVFASNRAVEDLSQLWKHSEEGPTHAEYYLKLIAVDYRLQQEDESYP